MTPSVLGLVWSGPVSPDRPPLDPTAEDARQQLARELAKAQYQAGRPSLIDTIVGDIQKWFNSLFDKTAGGLPISSNLIILIVVAVIVAAIVVVFLVFGAPRLNRRSTASGVLFGTEDDRTSDLLRRDAERAAAAGDFALATAEGFRSIARGLEERAVVTTFPGTTAHGFAMQAAGAFPDFSSELARAANIFDGVRYLSATGTESDWQVVADLERRIRSATPRLEPQDA